MDCEHYPLSPRRQASLAAVERNREAFLWAAAGAMLPARCGAEAQDCSRG